VPGTASIFLVFLKIGAFALGGVYSMLSFFERELVDRRGWLDRDAFAEGVAVGQMTPGPPIINTGVFIGYRLGGLPGAVAAAAGLVIPGFFIILAFGWLYIRYHEVPALDPVLKGIGAAVVGFLLSVVYRLAGGLIKDKAGVLLAAASFLLLFFVKANPIALIAVSGLAGYMLYGRGR